MKARQKLYRFTVEGRGQLPIDMLRHDMCFPATEMDSVLCSEHAAGRKVIALIGLDRPHIGRWDSFGWKVDNVEEVV